MKILERTPIFASDWYAETYRDVQILEMDPLRHYMRYGGFLRRDPSPFFDARTYADRHGLTDDENPVVHFTETYGGEPRDFPTLAMSDLKAKLWGGFSGLSVDLLKKAIHSGKYKKTEKAEAAFLLGRWHALSEEWDEAVKYLRMISKFDIKLFRSVRCKLMLVDTLIRAEDFDKAREMIDFVLGKGMNGHFVCARNNLLAAEGADAQTRFAAFNELFEDAGIAPMRLADPDKGAVFGNWDFDIPASKPVDGPKVSVLMPVYGAEDFIEVAVKSLLAQTWQNLEIIAVEDRSPDGSWEKLQELAKQDDRLKIHRNDVNMGAYPTRNRALGLATGEFITVHDSDDWSHPEMIEIQMKALLENPEVKGTCSAMARVYPDLTFILRPQRNNLEFVHRSYPSLLMRRVDIDQLKEWDLISANADDEFIQRARMKWGDGAILDVMTNVPLSLFLVHENSLTQQKGTNLNSLTFGIRREYGRQAKYWRDHKQADQEAMDLSLARTSFKSPFPIPQGLGPKNWERNTHYDIVLISDMALLGGTRRCNEGYIAAATALGLRVGLFHWPRFDLRLADVAPEYLELAYQDNVDILVPEDEITAGAILIHHPPILKYEIDAVPQIKADKLSIIVNQSPMQRWSNAPHYYDAGEVQKTCQKLFGLDPEWIAISPRVQQVLKVSGGFDNIRGNVWYPPHHGTLPDTLPPMPEGFGTDREIVIGRHARDHWTKWPAVGDTLKTAYCGDEAGIVCRLLGGDNTPRKLLGDLPANWDVLEFDSVTVPEFVQNLDFFLHFVHEDYIEEFGRNVMEAMAFGRVAILPPSFRDIFLDAAVYCQPEEVAETVRRYWSDPELYRAQAQKGLDFVRNNCAQLIIQDNLRGLLD
ncbi:glycosyltransferase [Jannaschia sp. M317]|uniref:glycosyltransferase n=1 Tax=Jannaschia sp. M317 TaxID=2867011 RepID=UPI0021A48683|nr:glycosyltransferase [Jannaschia sp. M317]UWQ19677.1 glycosyltransferase [Jannaschia sp. M317]